MKKLSLSLLLCALIMGLGGCGNDKDDGNDINVTCVDCNTLTLEQIQEKLESATVKIEASKANSKITLRSGFLIDSIGHIVTNTGAVAGASEIRVQVKGENRLITAKMVAYAECANLVVLQLNSDTNAEYLNWYKQDISRGMSIASAGFSNDIKDENGESIYTYMDGSINTTPEKKPTPWAYIETFNHSAKLVGGSLGGPIIELTTGKVVGINYAIVSNKERQIAISAKAAQTYVNKMLKGENINSIGIQPNSSTYSISKESAGVRVMEVVSGMQASKIGIKKGDMITSLGGTFLRYSQSMDSKQRERLKTLDRYCSILESQNPNNPNDIEDKGAVISIEIERFAQGKKNICKGEINGESLTLKSDSSQPCPE